MAACKLRLLSLQPADASFHSWSSPITQTTEAVRAQDARARVYAPFIIPLLPPLELVCVDLHIRELA